MSSWIPKCNRNRKIFTFTTWNSKDTNLTIYLFSSTSSSIVLFTVECWIGLGLIIQVALKRQSCMEGQGQVWIEPRTLAGQFLTIWHGYLRSVEHRFTGHNAPRCSILRFFGDPQNGQKCIKIHRPRLSGDLCLQNGTLLVNIAIIIFKMATDMEYVWVWDHLLCTICFILAINMQKKHA